MGVGFRPGAPVGSPRPWTWKAPLALRTEGPSYGPGGRRSVVDQGGGWPPALATGILPRVVPRVHNGNILDPPLALRSGGSGPTDPEAEGWDQNLPGSKPFGP